MNSTYQPPYTDVNSYNRSTGELFLLIAWSATSLILSLSGNILILAALSYQAFRIDKLSLLIIKNLAVSDIYFNVIWVLPTLITLVYGNVWILGDRLCEFTSYLQYPPAIATIFFITVLSVNKYIRCRFPLSTLDLTTAVAYKITICVWGFSFVHPTAYFLSNLVKSDKRAMELDLFKGSCDYHHGADLTAYWNILDLVCSLVCCMGPSGILLASNAGILMIVKQKGRGNMKMSNLILTISLTYIFFVSYTPYTVKYLVPMLQLGHDVLPPAFNTLTYFLLYVNSWANAFIYYFTNKTFRQFVNCTLRCEGYRSTRRSTCSLRIVESSRVGRHMVLQPSQHSLVKRESFPDIKRERVKRKVTERTFSMTMITEKLHRPSRLETCDFTRVEKPLSSCLEDRSEFP